MDTNKSKHYGVIDLIKKSIGLAKEVNQSIGVRVGVRDGDG